MYSVTKKGEEQKVRALGNDIATNNICKTKRYPLVKRYLHVGLPTTCYANVNDATYSS